MHRFLLAFRSKPFLFLWLSELFAQIAMNMMNFILILLVFSLTNSNTAVSGIVLSFTIPAIFFGIIAGVFVDYWNKKHILIGTNVIRFILMVLLAFFHTNLVVLYTVSFVIGIVTQFFIPAETPMIPLLVAKEQLFSANALFSMAWFGSVLISYALSGSFLLLFGKVHALLALSTMYFIAAVFAFLVKVPRSMQIKKSPRVEKVSIIGEIKNALEIIVKIRDVSHAFFLLCLSQVLILIISVVGPGYATHILHIKVEEFPLFFVTPAVVGMVVGSYTVTNYFHRFSRHKSANLGLFIAAIAVFLMPYGEFLADKSFVHAVNVYLPGIVAITILHIMMVLAFLLGFANSFIFVPSNTLVQENTSDEMRGKIYGVLNTVASLFSLLPVILVGSFADVFGVGTVLTMLSIVVFIIGLLRLML